MIEWREGSVCYADGKQWRFNKLFHGITELISCNGASCCSGEYALTLKDFQLNEPKSGYYIPKSELDTEAKYNQAVEVFGLFGYEYVKEESFTNFRSPWDNLAVSNGGVYQSGLHVGVVPVKLTLDQLTAIGELKRKMNERDELQNANKAHSVRLSDLPIFKAYENKPAKKRKSKEAYRVLESMGVEWDNDEGKWFKVSKEWL